MDRKKLQKQARVLRNKRLKKTNVKPPKATITTVKNGVVKVDAPVPEKPKDNSRLAPPSKAEIRRTRHERILAQRKALIKRRSEKQSTQTKARGKSGCSGCRRKIGGK